jgi:L-proline amide hydrolase
VTKSGTVSFVIEGERFETWYRVDGSLRDDRPPLIALHGGPGGTHDYLTPLAELAKDGFCVVLYDQLGNGNSTHLNDRDNDFWTVQLFVQELQNLIRQLGIGNHHILGQSWGGFLAQEYALTHPPGLRSLLLADTAASMPDFVAECTRLRSALPTDVEATLQQHETAGSTSDPSYAAACEVFYKRHLCRLEPWPPELVRTLEQQTSDPTVYLTMNGPSDFFVTGSIRNWDVKGRLQQIDVPTLILSGRYDQATPALQETLLSRIPSSDWVLFERSSHLPHLEEREQFLETASSWLTRH